MNHLIEVESVGCDGVLLTTLYNLKRLDIASVRIVKTPDGDKQFAVVMESESGSAKLFFTELDEAKAVYNQVKAYISSL